MESETATIVPDLQFNEHQKLLFCSLNILYHHKLLHSATTQSVLLLISRLTQTQTLATELTNQNTEINKLSPISIILNAITRTNSISTQLISVGYYIILTLLENNTLLTAAMKRFINKNNHHESSTRQLSDLLKICGPAIYRDQNLFSEIMCSGYCTKASNSSLVKLIDSGSESEKSVQQDALNLSLVNCVLRSYCSCYELLSSVFSFCSLTLFGFVIISKNTKK